MTAFVKSLWLGTMQFLILLVLLQKCIGQTTTTAAAAATTTTTTTTTTTSDPAPDCAKVHNLTGPTDIVFLIDRSTSVGNDNFQDMKTFAKDILEKHTRVSPDHTRVAVISFGSYKTEDINYISASNSALIHECEFLHERGPFQTKVQYQDMNSNSENNDRELLDALEQAGKVLDEGRTARPDVRQVIWLMTDYHDLEPHHNEVKELADTLKDREGVLMFGHGVGSYHTATERQDLRELVSTPHMCYYDSERTTASLSWNFTDPGKSGESGEWRNVTMGTVCNDTCTLCQCQEYGNVNYESTYRCLASTVVTDQSDDDWEWDTLTYVFFSLGGLALILILLLVPCYWCCCRKSKKHKEETETPSSGAEGEGEGEGDSEDFYQNQLVADIWEQATMQRNKEKRTSVETIPTSPDYLEPVPSLPRDRGTSPTTLTIIPDQYLTPSLERNPPSGEYVNIDLEAERQKRLNVNGHVGVTNPGYEQHTIESSTPRNGFLEEFQRKWQQIRKNVVSTVRIKMKGRRDQVYENEGTIESISRRHHENSNNAEAETNAGAIVTGDQSEAERENRRSFWHPFRKTTSSQHYENEETIERIRQNKLEKKNKDGKQTQRGARNFKSLLRRFDTTTLQQNETETRSSDRGAGLSVEVPLPTPPAGVHSPTTPRAPYLELI